MHNSTFDYFSDVSDPRVVGRCSYLLSDILFIGLCAYLTGGSDCCDMHLFGSECGTSLYDLLSSPNVSIAALDGDYRKKFIGI